MTLNEEKVETETTDNDGVNKQETSSEETKSDVVDEPVQDSETSSSDKEIDYEAELEKERKARKLADEKLEITREKARERMKMREAEPSDDDSNDEPLTRAYVEDLIKKTQQETEKALIQSQIRETAQRFTTSPSETEFVMEIYKSHSFPSHLSVEEQVKRSVAIANSERLIAERNEAMRALRARDSRESNVASTHHDKAGGNRNQPGRETKAVLEQQGFTWSSNNQRFEKALSNGKTMVSDKAGKITLA